MSIVAYVGLPGSGKSYGVVENVVIPALRAGRRIITNIPLRIGYLKEDFPAGEVVFFTSSDARNNEAFFNLDDWPGAIWIIDECQLFWPSGLKVSEIPDLQKSFFTEHRHSVGPDGLTSEIVLVTQNLDQVSAFIRNLVEDTYRAKKLSALGASKSYTVSVFSGGQKGTAGGTPNRTLHGTYKPDVFKYYKSHTKNKTDFAAGMEEKADTRNNVFKSGFFRVVIPIALIVAVFSVYQVSAYLWGRDDEPATKPGAKPSPAVHDASSKFQTAKAAHSFDRPAAAAEAMKRLDISREYLPLSKTHRITGQIGDSFMIWTDEGTRIFKTSLCSKFSNTKEDYCVFNGELVTWYSSHVPDLEPEREYFESEEMPSATEIF